MLHASMASSSEFLDRPLQELFGVAVAARESRHEWQECPIDKRLGIKAAFRYFVLNDPQWLLLGAIPQPGSASI